MAIELPGYLITVFNIVGLPWPGIDEDELRGWATSVRTFADGVKDHSTRTHQTVTGLAADSQSEFLNTLAARWESHHKVITDLHEPLNVFADALDVGADVVEAQKGVCIGAFIWLAGELAADVVGAFFTFGADAAAAIPEIISTREIVENALQYVEGQIEGELINLAFTQINDHLNNSIVKFAENAFGDYQQASGELQALKVAYADLQKAGKAVQGHSQDTDEVGNKAYRDNSSREIADHSGSGNEGGDGGKFAAVIRAIERGLQVILDLIRAFARAVAQVMQHFAGMLLAAVSDFSDTDAQVAGDVRSPETAGAPEVGSATRIDGGSRDDPGSGRSADPAAGGGRYRGQHRKTLLSRLDGHPGLKKAIGKLTGQGDPVDVSSGDVIVAETDVTLPGILPLVLERTHRSSLQAGRWLGPAWLSSFDQGLVITPDRVTGTFADGRVLSWPHPGGDSGDEPLPDGGAQWPLRRNRDGSYAVSDPQRGLTWRFEHRAGYEAGPGDQGELPLVSVTDRIGHEIAFNYGGDGQPASVVHSGGYRVRVTTTNGLVTALTLAGRDGEDDVELRRFDYDANGNLSGVVNSSGLPLRYSYDEAGRLTGWVDRNGHYYRYAFDGEGRCVSGEGPGGALSGTFAYEPGQTTWTDASGAITVYEISDAAEVTAITDPLGNVTRQEHDAWGHLTTEIDPLGRITRYAYDERGNLTAVTRPDGSQATAEYDDHCQPVTLTSPDGAIWRQEYDARGNQVRVVAQDGGTTRLGYDSAGHLAQVTGADGTTVRVSCNAAGLPVEVTEPGGAQTSYDLNQLGQVARITAPDGGVTTLSWTTEGLLSARELPDGANESWTWDGEDALTRHVSPVGAATSYEYGPFDKVTAIDRPDGTRTEFRYDHQLRLTDVIHAGLAWHYDYDEAGRLTGETDYNGATQDYGYDAAGQLTSRVNAAGQETAYRYDVLGNLVEAGSGGAVTAFGYDPLGRLATARSADADLRIDRDARGRVTAETCNGRTVTTEYDAMGRVTRTVTPSGAAAAWEYDPAGQPVTLSASGHQLRFGYDAAGQEVRRDLPGGLTLTQGWDQRGRLTLQALAGLPEGPASPARALQRRAYRYRSDGLVTSIDDLLSGARAIGLDRVGRVTSVTGQDWAEQYAYDPAGNLTAATWPAAASGPAAPWLDVGAQGPREVTGTLVTRAGNIRYRHDRQGRVIQRTRTRISRRPDTWRYQWDADDRLTSVTTPDGSSWRYAYDPFGRRVGKTHIAPDGTVTEQTAFAWSGPVLVEQATTGQAADGEQVTTWTYAPGTFTPLTQAESASSYADPPQAEVDRAFYGIVTDLVGTPAELTGADGTLAGRRIQTLWGGTTWLSDGASTPLRFPGQYHDPETGLHYNNQRYYDPVGGCYLSPDPLGLIPGPNPQAYVANPYAEVDPLGLKKCTVNTNPTDLELLQAIAKRADRRINKAGAAAGTAKHKYAELLLRRYQAVYGDRGLVTEQSYLNGQQVPKGTPGSSRPDVYNPTTGIAYDYKFTQNPPGLTQKQVDNSAKNIPGYKYTFEVNP